MKPNKHASVYRVNFFGDQSYDRERFNALHNAKFYETELEEVDGEIGINFGCGRCANLEEEHPYHLNNVSFSISRSGNFYFTGPCEFGFGYAHDQAGLNELVYENDKTGEIISIGYQGISDKFRDRFTQKVKP